MSTVLRFRKEGRVAQRECASLDHALEIASRLMQHDIGRPLAIEVDGDVVMDQDALEDAWRASIPEQKGFR
ncbi:MAG: hypothetical protein M3497_08975 [Gemmatimonadota bacterium]|nr:hypothetical protein [Gemmatimonadota bacterium]